MSAPGTVTTVPSLAELQNLVDPHHIQTYFNALEDLEIQADIQLDTLLGQQQRIRNELQVLDQLAPKFGVLLSSSQQITVTVSQTAALAESTSAKVRQLDLEQSRVQEMLKLADSILELKQCISGLKEAMENKVNETAAVLMHRYLNFDRKIVDLVLSDTLEGRETKEVLRKCELELREIIVHEFDAATRAYNEEAIMRYLKLFPFLKMGEEGLLRYSDYLCGLVETRADSELKNFRATAGGSEKSHSNCVELFTKLFEHVANIVDAQEPVIDTHYSPGKMLGIIQRLQRECDQRAKKILDVFKEQTQYQEKIRNFRSNKSIADTVDPRELDSLLGEIVLLSQTTELYNSFITQRFQGQLENINVEEESDGQKQQALLRLKKMSGKGWVRETGLNRMLQEVMADYVFLEELFLRRSVDKALKIEEWEEGNHTSSSVDDVFYIMKKCVTRALSSSNIDSFCAVINLVVKTCEVGYLTALNQNLSQAPHFTFEGGGGGGGGDHQPSSAAHKNPKVAQMVLLNNIDVSCDNLNKLKQDVESNAQRVFVKDMDKINSCLSQMTDAHNNFQSSLEAGLGQFFSANWKTPIRSLISDGGKDLKYVVQEEEYDEQDLKESLVSKIISEVEKGSKFYQKYLTENNFSKFFGLLVQCVVLEFEKQIMTKGKFNQLGAMLFDKHVRTLSSYLTSSASWSTKDKFTKLTQISTLLNMERVQEIYDYWGNKSGSLSWRLNANEVRQILALRVEFKSDDINKLKL